MLPVTVASGDAALEAARTAASDGAPIRLVLLDHVLPGEDGRAIASRLHADGAIGAAPCVLMSSMGALPPAVEDEAMGIQARVSKPVIASQLLEAIHGVLTSGAPRAEPRRGPRVGAVLRATRPLHVLIAEDNPFNQRVAIALLERMGHSVVAADNGRLAIEALARERFDVVLMDAQMPELDGFEATRAIRATETADRPRLRIIALTAQAMTGDRERCLAAGADDYVSKPIRFDVLYEALERQSSAARIPVARPR